MSHPAGFKLDSDRLSIRWPSASLEDLQARVKFADGSFAAGSKWTARADSASDFDASCGPVDISLRLQPEDGRVVLRLGATARDACELVEIGVRATPTLAGNAPRWMLYSGYQSWDRAGLHSLAGTPHAQESWWLTALLDEAGSGLVSAADACAAFGTRFELREGLLTLASTAPPRAGALVTMWEAEPGDSWCGEPVSLEFAGGAVAALRRLLSGGRSVGRTPQGWLSWYRYGPWIEATEVLANAEVLAGGPLAGLGYEVVQIDDGWQQAFGDWHPNSRFEALPDLVAQLQRLGHTVGVWTAPFMVSSDSALATTVPDSWFLHGADGRRLVDPREGLPIEMFILDAANPEVREHLRSTFTALREMGFGYFKIDYLYAGAYAGFAAYRKALEIIREAVGECYLLACGAPLMPVAGLADGCRVWEDTARPIYSFEDGAPQPTIFGDEVQWAARNMAARLPMASWFQLDPDIALVGGNLPLAQARQLVSLVAISGGPFFSSDDLPGLPPERLELLSNRDVLRLVGRGPAVPDWEPRERDLPPSVWRLGQEVVVAFNWSSNDGKVEVTKPGRWRCRELWSGAVREVNDRFEAQLASDGVAVFEFEPAS